MEGKIIQEGEKVRKELAGAISSMFVKKNYAKLSDNEKNQNCQAALNESERRNLVEEAEIGNSRADHLKSDTGLLNGTTAIIAKNSGLGGTSSLIIQQQQHQDSNIINNGNSAGGG